MSSRSKRQLNLDIRWGLRWGATAALYGVLVAMLVGLLRWFGGESGGNGEFAHVTFSSLLVTSAAWWVLAGPVLGLLRPLGAKSKAGAAVVGGVVTGIMQFGGLFSIGGLQMSAWDPALWGSIPLAAVLVGPLFGVIFKNTYSGTLRYDPESDRFRLYRSEPDDVADKAGARSDYADGHATSVGKEEPSD